MCYSLMAAFLQMAVTASGGRVSSTELVLIRAVVQGLVVVVAMIVCRDETTGKRFIWIPLGQTRAMQKLVIARGMVGGAGFLLYYYTIRVLPLGDATTLLSLNPVLTVVVAPLVLPQDEPTWQTSHLVAAVASVIGCLLMTQPTFLFPPHDNDFDDDDNIEISKATTTNCSIGYVTAILGACTGAVVFLLIRRAGQTGVHTLQLLFSWVLFGILFSLCISIGVPLVSSLFSTPSNDETNIMMILQSALVWPPQAAWPYIAGMSVVGTGAHFLLNYAARLAPAGLSSLMRTSGIVWAFFFEWLFFDATPDPLVTLGVLLIVGSLAAIALEKYFQNLNDEAETVNYDNDDSTTSSGSGDNPNPDIELPEHAPLKSFSTVSSASSSMEIQ
jgi:drug/metabolite transporter (DMT)-like permease